MQGHILSVGGDALLLEKTLLVPLPRIPPAMAPHPTFEHILYQINSTSGWPKLLALEPLNIVTYCVQF